MIEIIFPSISSVLSITAIGALFGLILSVAKVKLNIERDPRFNDVLESLPGANCGACGEPGCSGYTSQIIQGSVPPNLCPVGGAETIKKICEIMGMEAEIQIPMKAKICCQGGINTSAKAFIYDGPRSCIAAQQIMGGFKVCRYGCFSLGDCVRSCPFDAIHLTEGGLPQVNEEKCAGCGNCVTACPRNIISLMDEKTEVYVICKNREKGPTMKKGCTVGCIACNRCVKVCKEVFSEDPDVESAIKLIDFLAIIDYDKCINCGKCAEICPQKVISFEKLPVLA